MIPYTLSIIQSQPLQRNDDVGEQSGFDDYRGQIDLVSFEEDETVCIFIFFFGFANERDAKKR